MLTTKRKSVEKHLIRKTYWCPVYFLKITYEDGRVTYGVSADGLTLFPYEGGREKAWKYAHEVKVYGLGSTPR
jgi:hypothetical protein